ncbi:MAG: sodium:proton antiporter [Pseudomonadales bacterium]
MSAIEPIVAFAVLLFALSLLADRLGTLLRLPHTLVLVVMGAAVAWLLTGVLGLDTGLRAMSFHDLVFFVFLPVLVFESAYHIPVRILRDNLGVILFLAIVGMTATALVSAALIFWGIGDASGFPWVAALLTGALLAATDPVAVVAQLKEMGAPERLTMLLEGESLFNDASAIVLFTVFLGVATGASADADLGSSLLNFLGVFFGGLGVGVVAGLFGVGALWLFRAGVGHALIILTVAYGSFLVAEAVLHVSGILATLLAGLILARFVQREDSPIVGSELSFVLQVLSYAANGSVFLLVGMTLTLPMFTERWLAMLIAIGAVLVARMVIVFGAMPVLNLAIDRPVPLGYQGVMVWGGLRGAVTLALALSLPATLDYWWTVQAMAYGVVMFTLMLQAPTMPWLIRRTVIGPRTPDRDRTPESAD